MEVDAPRAVSISEDEKIRGCYTPQNLQQALEGLHQDGLVLLKGVVDVDHIDSLNTSMSAAVDDIVSNPEMEFNHAIPSNFLQRPPVTQQELLYEDVYFNPFLLQVANAYLGHKPIWNWLTANTAIANTSGMRQPPHKDCTYEHPQYPYYFIANIPLCDFSVENGATEFWLGTSVHATAHEQVVATGPENAGAYGRLGQLPNITEQAKEARRRIRPPVQPVCHRGDIMIRDIRTWHAGMPNQSNRHRIMLGLGYQSPVYPNYSQTCHLPAAHREFFLGTAGDRVQVRANFYSDEELAKTKADKDFLLRPAYLDDARKPSQKL